MNRLEFIKLNVFSLLGVALSVTTPKFPDRPKSIKRKQVVHIEKGPKSLPHKIEIGFDGGDEFTKPDFLLNCRTVLITWYE